jgi:hypothetical protein
MGGRRRRRSRCDGVVARQGASRGSRDTGGLQRAFQLFLGAGSRRQPERWQRCLFEQLQVVEQAQHGRGMRDADVSDAAHSASASGLAPASQTPDHPGQGAAADEVRDVLSVKLSGPKGGDHRNVGQPTRAAQPSDRLIELPHLMIAPCRRRQSTVDAVQLSVIGLSDEKDRCVVRRHGAGPRDSRLEGIGQGRFIAR